LKVPFLDLGKLHREVGEEIAAALGRVVASDQFVLGPELDAFEAEFADYCGVRHCVGVGNGLEALELLLRAHNIGPGCEVIVPAGTFIATWLAVTRTGAVPIPVDVRADTGNIDAAGVEHAVTPRTRAIIAVHLYGQPADMTALASVARRFDLLLFEDAAQAHGARHRGRRAGSLADGAATSFYPGKNLGALGDGGAVLVDDARLARRLRMYRNYGAKRKYHHEALGTNSRLDEVQAAVLRIKLRRLDEWNARRHAIAQRYRRLLDGAIDLPAVPVWAQSAWHLFVIRHPRRDALQRHLEACGVSTMIHYPVAPHRQPCYADAYAEAAMPHAEAQCRQVLSLPICPTMTEEQCDAVAAAVLSFGTRRPPHPAPRAAQGQRAVEPIWPA
jgi:dTDP-4-amino-4,6-dideoxygalactose transaminase